MQINKVQPISSTATNLKTRSNTHYGVVKPVEKMGTATDKKDNGSDFNEIFKEEINKSEERPSVKTLKR